MTATITIQTFSNPVSVNLYGGSGEQREPHRRSFSHASSTEFIPANETREFNISGDGSMSVQELPAEARDLDHADELRNATAGASGTAVG